LDDAYNSNENGFKGALVVLDKIGKARGGRRILVTPGIAELGNQHDIVHARIANFCKERCDLVYLIRADRLPTMHKGLIDANVEIICVESFSEAKNIIMKSIKPNDVLLLENDFPDILESKRIL
jgi:UDP-N-acetylmuramoyl-tripeptide--D-alanyl-D-alanine ligase